VVFANLLNNKVLTTFAFKRLMNLVNHKVCATFLEYQTN